MKAKTKLQKKVVELFSHLPEITEKQLQRASRKAGDGVVIYVRARFGAPIVERYSVQI